MRMGTGKSLVLESQKCAGQEGFSVFAAGGALSSCACTACHLKTHICAP